jgi:hypothetical protein
VVSKEGSSLRKPREANSRLFATAITERQLCYCWKKGTGGRALRTISKQGGSVWTMSEADSQLFVTATTER